MDNTEIKYHYGCSRQDVNKITEFINSNLEFDKFSPTQVEHLIFDDPNFNDELVIQGYLNNTLVSFLCAVKSIYKQKHIGWIKIFVVDKQYRFKGIGKKMFAVIEEKLSSCDEIRIMDSVPCYFQPGVDVRYTEAVVFLESLGYKKIGENIHLETQLENVDFNLITEIEQKINMLGYNILQPDKKLYSEIISWIRKTFPAWEFEVNYAYKNTPAKLFVVVHGNNIVGFSCYDTTSPGWFGPIGVDSQHRKIGLGKILLLKCLKELYNLGYTTVVIPWISPSSLKFYTTTCNAKISRCFWVYAKVKG